MVVRGRSVELDGTPPPGVPTDQGALVALEALLARVPRAAPRRAAAVPRRRRRLPRLRRRARDRAAPRRPPRRPRPARCGAVGHRARHRVRPLPPAPLPDRERVPRSGYGGDAAAAAAYDARAADRLASRVDELARPLPYIPSPPPASELDELPDVHVDDGGHLSRGRRSGARAHPRRRHLPGRARAALRPRRPLRSVRRVPRAAPGQPVALHVLRAPSRGHARGFVARADGAAARRACDQPPDRGHPAPRPHRRRRPAHGRRAHRAPEGARRARDARRPRPERRRPGREVRHRAGRRAHGAREVLARHAPHQPGRRRPRRRAERGRRAAAPRSPPAPSAAPPRCGPWRSSTRSSRPSAAPTRAWSGYVDFSGNLDTAIAIRTMVWRDGQASVQAGAGIVADSVAADEDLECHNKARALLTAAAAAARPRATRIRQERNERNRRARGTMRDAAASSTVPRGFVLVTGEDARSFLQALVSADLDPLAAGRASRSLLLTPQGKLDVAFRLLVVGDDVWLDTDPGLGAQLADVAEPVPHPREGRSGRPVRRVGHGVAHRARRVRPVDGSASRAPCTSHLSAGELLVVRTEMRPRPRGRPRVDRLRVGDAHRRRLADGSSPRCSTRSASNVASRCSRSTSTTRPFPRRPSSSSTRSRSPRAASSARSSCAASTAAGT